MVLYNTSAFAVHSEPLLPRHYSGPTWHFGLAVALWRHRTAGLIELVDDAVGDTQRTRESNQVTDSRGAPQSDGRNERKSTNQTHS